MSSWTMDLYLRYGETSISRPGNYMQREAPELLDLNVIKGEKDGLREINSIMLSESLANTLFGEEDPIGRTVKIDNQNSMEVSAVYEDIPSNNTFSDTEYIVPWDYYLSVREWAQNAEDDWDENSFQMFVQLVDNANMEEVSSKIANVKKNLNEDTAEFDPQLFLFPMKEWYLHGNFENGKQVGGRIQYVWLFGIIGVFILLLACINFMNLSTARSEKKIEGGGCP